MAQVKILIHEFGCFYGFKKGFPVLVRGHPLLMTSKDFDRLLNESFNSSWLIFGSCNTVLIESEERMIVDPGVRELGSWGVLESRLKELGLTPLEIDTVINTHLHGDHAGSNFVFRGKRLIVHEKEILPSGQYKWPEFTEACVKTLKVQKVSSDTKISEDVEVITTPGHTPGSLSVIVDTPEGLVAIVGDAINSREDFLKRKAPEWIEDKETYLKSIDRLREINPEMVIPGHDSPFHL